MGKIFRGIFYLQLVIHADRKRRLVMFECHKSYSKAYVLLLVAITLMISGCAKRYEWYSYTKSNSDFNSNNYSCQQQAAQLYPPIIQTVSYGTGHTTNSTTTCTGDYSYRHCTTTPGKYVPPPTSNVDVNQGNRDQAYSSCMSANGWALREKQR